MYCVLHALYTGDTLMSKIDKILALMELTVAAKIDNEVIIFLIFKLLYGQVSILYMLK